MGFDPITLAIGGALLGGVLGGQKQQQQMPTPATPEKPPASQTATMASATSDVAGMNGAGQAGGSSGISSTLLTGAGGVNPNGLQLGKKTLLGG